MASHVAKMQFVPFMNEVISDSFTQFRLFVILDNKTFSNDYASWVKGYFYFSYHMPFKILS